MSLADLSAVTAAEKLLAGEITSAELTAACLERIEAREKDVRAFAHLDPEHAMAQAKASDEARQSGEHRGPLAGLPVGVKDIFDTSDMPCENGSKLFEGRNPDEDSMVVSLLRRAGAVVMGKTVTTECAFYSPGKTTNPHDPARTPGGSSSGSAAAVAAGMVPLAVGTQTNGSIIRPASFCGVVGFKPSHASISRRGVLLQSPPLDTVGVFGRTLEDAALLCDALDAYDPGDPDMTPRAHMGLLEKAISEPPVAPQLAFVKTPAWDGIDDDTAEAFAELKGFLGESCDEVDLPQPFEEAAALHRTIMAADIAKNLGPLRERGNGQLSEVLLDTIAEGEKVSAVDYHRAIDMVEVLNAGLERIFERYDAIVTPAAAGQAPVGLGSTGDPAFCTLWTLCGLPAISLPLIVGGDGMPIGVQVIGQRRHDGRLIRNARWLMSSIVDGADTGDNETA